MKRIISIVCSVVLLFSMLSAITVPIAVSATETDGDFSYITSSENEVTITDYTGVATELTIPSSLGGCAVTAIASRAFYGCESLIRVTVPNSVTKIGEQAFSDCYSLISIIIPDSVTTIGNYALSNCRALVDVTLSNGITRISTGMFRDCFSLTSISIPETVKSIGYRAFHQCRSLKSITIPNSVTDIGTEAFIRCEKLVEVVFSNRLETIGSWAFSYCASLASVKFPNTLTTIESYAFYDCDSLTDVTISECVTAIGVSAFSGCKLLERVVMFDSVTAIGSSAFSGCTSLVDITLSDSITAINDSVFDGCDLLKTITIPSKVTSIGDRAFRFCDSLSSIRLPNTLVRIGDYVFEGCSSLEGIVLGENVTNIGSFAFSDCTLLRDITIPDRVEDIGEHAFSNCISLVEITLPNSLVTVQGAVFGHCKSLTSVTIPSSIENIQYGAFDMCTNLTNVFYGGNQAQWRGIVIGDHNESLISATVHFVAEITGVTDVTDNLYYINSDGTCKTGKFWVTATGANGLVDAGYVYTDATGRFYNNEFVDVDGVLYYMERGQPSKTTGVREIDGNLYSLNHKGQVNIGKFWVTAAGTNGLITEGYVYTDETGRIYNNEFTVLDDGITYYMLGGRPDKTGGGIREMNGNLYYVSWKGILQTGEVYVSNPNGYSVKGVHYTDEAGRFYNNVFVRINGKLHYMVNGRIYTNGGGVEEIGGELYYISWKGEVQVGTIYVSNPNGYTERGTHYTDSEGRFYRDEIVNINGKPHYLVNGRVYSTPGVIEVDGGLYYVTWEGPIATGNVYVTYTNGLINTTGWHYADETGRFLNETFTTSNGKTYYIVQGAVYSTKGVLKVDEEFYYVSYNGSIVVNGTVKITADNQNGYDIPVGTYTTDGDGRIIL